MTTAISPTAISLGISGELCVKDASGNRHDGVMPVRAFPITAPTQGISLVDAHGHEQLWIADLAALPDYERGLVERQLAAREFQPEIRAILAVSSYSTPSRWQVDTDRGETVLVLKGEEDIRRLSSTRFLIAADNGLHFLVADTRKLDPASRRRLERFL